jgi:uncharacterized repeat protein (TIGR01451 family)
MDASQLLRGIVQLPTRPRPGDNGTYDRNIYLERRILRDPGVDRAFLREIKASSQPVHGIVQLHTLPRPGDIEDVEELGINLLGYLSGKTGFGTAYLASISPQVGSQDPKFGELVRGLQRLQPGDKKSVSLPAPSSEPMDVGILFFSDVSAAEAAEVLENVGVNATRNGNSNLYEGSATGPQIEALAEEDDVQWVEPVQEALPTLDVVRATHNVDPVQQLNTTTGTYAGLSGQGVQIAIMDTGVDTSHNDFAGRFVRSQDDSGDHGTFVAGAAAGSGFQSDKNDNAGNPNGGTPFQWRGMAPRSGIAAYAQVNNNPAVFSDAINVRGVDVSNHSYVMDDQGHYNANIATFDQIIRGDSPGVPARPAVSTAANNGNVFPRDCDGDGNPDGSFPQYPFPAVPPGGPCPTAYQAGYFSVLAPTKNSVNVASIIPGSLLHTPSSSMGPTMDGRLKPEISAIGATMQSTCADTSLTPQGLGCDGGPNPGPGNGYRGFGGTSAAAPVIAGIMALMLEQYANTFGVNLDVAPPLPSTSKAILIQTATDLVGTDPPGSPVNFDTGAPTQYGPGPDWVTGYGSVDAQAAVQMVADRRFLEDSVSEINATDEHLVSVVPGQPELRLTLAWDDIAGVVNNDDSAPQLVNDLDLVLFGPNGEVHRPFVLPGQPAGPGGGTTLVPRDCDGNAANGVQVGTCIGQDNPAQNYFGPATEGTDRLNNVEQVVIPNPAPGTWRAQVSVLNGDGTNRLPQGGTQPYTLAGGTTAGTGADLSVTKTDSPDPVQVGGTLTYTLTVHNDGPETANGVVLTDTLPASVTFVGANASQGSCAHAAGVVTCSLGPLAAGAVATVTIQVTPNAPGTITNTASVTANEADPDPSDNTDSEDTTVQPADDDDDGDGDDGDDDDGDDGDGDDDPYDTYDDDPGDAAFDFDSPFDDPQTSAADSGDDAAGHGTNGIATKAPTAGEAVSDPVSDPSVSPSPRPGILSTVEVLGAVPGYDPAAAAPAPSSPPADDAGARDVGAGHGELPRTGSTQQMALVAAALLLMATSFRKAARRGRRA